jgi:hypothetical protein
VNATTGPGRGAGLQGTTAGALWGSEYQLNDGLALDLPELAALDDDDGAGLGDGGHRCFGLDTRDGEAEAEAEAERLVPLEVARAEAPKERADGGGLFARCEAHLQGVAGGMGPVDLGGAVLDILNRARDDVELQTRLFELLGERVS